MKLRWSVKGKMNPWAQRRRL